MITEDGVMSSTNTRRIKHDEEDHERFAWPVACPRHRHRDVRPAGYDQEEDPQEKEQEEHDAQHQQNESLISSIHRIRTENRARCRPARFLFYLSPALFQHSDGRAVASFFGRSDIEFFDVRVLFEQLGDRLF
jgi:hypothetical protein